jgi:hypothetical protein
MPKEDEREVRDSIILNDFYTLTCTPHLKLICVFTLQWIDTMNAVHASVKGGMKYNTGKLLMVLYRPIEIEKE